jgi:glycosyltransferase involved in cell wall biosynthesis
MGVEQLVSKESGKLFTGLPFEPELIQCHNVRGRIFRIEDLPRLVQKAPVVWTFHDMWPITGHCCFSLDCERWKTGCGSCPYLRVPVKLRFDFSRLNRWRRRRVYGMIAKRFPGRLHIICPSRWLAELTKQSIAGRFPVHVIGNGIDTDLFVPPSDEKRRELRRKAGLPEGAVAVLYAANLGRGNPFKDYASFEDAMKRIVGTGRKDVVFLVGGDPGSASPPVAAESVRFLGRANTPRQMADFYGTADIFVMATKADNHPLAAMEAHACGLPTVGSNVGGVPEIVDDGATGLLANPQDGKSMAECILALVDDKAMRERFGREGASKARQYFSLLKMIDNYEGLYREVLRGV